MRPMRRRDALPFQPAAAASGAARTCALALSAVLVLFAAPGAAKGATVPDEVRRAAGEGPVRVIVNLKADESAAGRPAASPGAGRERRRAVQRRLLDRLGGTAGFRLRHRFENVDALAGTVSPAALAALEQSPEVASVALDSGGTAALAETVPRIGADVLHATYGLAGDGVTVAVIDTGVDLLHPDLAGAVVAEECFCTGGCCAGGGTRLSGPGAAFDDAGHGTHVAGIVTSDGIVAPPGVAPGSEIVAIRALDATGFCCISDIAAALDWIITHRPDVRVVNMSLATFARVEGDCGTHPVFQPLAAAIDTLTANGVSVVAASGNDNDSTRLPAPACVANTVAVGAVYDHDEVAWFPNSGSLLDLLAPGVDVLSTLAGGGVFSSNGTSMASPHVAGAAALLHQAHPAMSAGEILDALAGTGVPIPDARNGLVRPRIDVEAALLSIPCGNGTVEPPEACDDGNYTSGDGCDSNCTTTACGNGVLSPGETCDDGNAASDDACKSDCTPNLCGDGVVRIGVEVCDDANLTDGDGCDSNCRPTGCGNEVVTAGEQCDHGAENGSDDCCAADCAVIDGDGDGTCDGEDGCPHVIGTAPAAALGLRKVVLRYGPGGPGGGDDAPTAVRLEFDGPPGLDPDSTHDVHVHFENTGDGGTLFETSLVAGGLWRQPNSRRRWIYADPARPAAAGVKRAVLAEASPGSGVYRFRLAGRDTTIDPNHARLDVAAGDGVRLRVEVESAGTGVCAEATAPLCFNRSVAKDECFD